MHAKHKVHAFKGVVTGFNLSPKGVPEGFLIRLSDGSGSAQVNFDSEVAGEVTSVAAESQTLTINAAEADAHPEAPHAVFNLIQLSEAGGKPLFVARGSRESNVVVKGKVVRLNHALRGEVNGAILDSGDFVHLRPHGVKAVGGLTVGQALEVSGEVRAGWSGHRVIEARTVNGIEITQPHPKPHKPHRPKAKTEAA